MCDLKSSSGWSSSLVEDCTYLLLNVMCLCHRDYSSLRTAVALTLVQLQWPQSLVSKAAFGSFWFIALAVTALGRTAYRIAVNFREHKFSRISDKHNRK